MRIFIAKIKIDQREYLKLHNIVKRVKHFNIVR